MRRNRGFSLIELMIVVAIVAVLAAIAMSQYQDYVIRAEVSEGLSLAAGPKAAVSAYAASRGRFPDSACPDGNNAVGLSMPASISGSFVSEVRVAGVGCPAPLGAGTILTLFSSVAPQEAHSDINTAALLFSPVTHAGSIEWKCKRFVIGGAVVLRDKWLPSSCR